MTKTRITLWLVLSGVAGALSGFGWMVPNGIMGVVLAIWLSLGTIWLSREHLRTNAPPTWNRVLLIGCAVGLLGGLTALGVQELFPPLARPNSEVQVFLPMARPAWAVVVGGLLYGFILHTAYRSRTNTEWPLARVLLCAVLGAGIGRSLLGPGNSYGSSGLVVAIFGAIPFAILWCVANRICDPAWALGNRTSTASKLPQTPLTA